MFKALRQKTKQVVEAVNDFDHEAAIHETVYGAADNIMAQYEAIISKQVTEDEERIQTLAQLGFNGSKSVLPVMQEKYERERLKESSEHIAYYREHYPFNRFIDEDTVTSLTKKYNLLCGDVRDFRGEIPVKNQKEIVAFRIMRKDAREIERWGRSGWLLPARITDWRTPEERLEDMNRLEAKQQEKIAGRSLQIIAPIEQFNTWEREIRDGRIMVKDPIVLQPVQGGYLIVTAWGKEANDVDVQNGALN